VSLTVYDAKNGVFVLLSS